MSAILKCWDVTLFKIQQYIQYHEHSYKNEVHRPWISSSQHGASIPVTPLYLTTTS